MSNIEITIHCPELALLAEAINHRTAAPAITEQPIAPPMPAPVPAQIPAPAYPTPAAAAVPPGPVQTATAPYPTAAPTYTLAIPTAAPVPMAPTAPVPTYTVDQITKAGAELVQAGKMGDLMALLQRFGVQAVTQVPQERLGELANALRGLGAKL